MAQHDERIRSGDNFPEGAPIVTLQKIFAADKPARVEMGIFRNASEAGKMLEGGSDTVVQKGAEIISGHIRNNADMGGYGPLIDSGMDVKLDKAKMAQTSTRINKALSHLTGKCPRHAFIPRYDGIIKSRANIGMNSVAMVLYLDICGSSSFNAQYNMIRALAHLRSVEKTGADDAINVCFFNVRTLFMWPAFFSVAVNADCVQTMVQVSPVM
jgi:hypothetical protein